MDEMDLAQAANSILDLRRELERRDQRNARDSALTKLCERYLTFMTALVVDDAEAQVAAQDAIAVFRLNTALRTLAGREDYWNAPDAAESFWDSARELFIAPPAKLETKTYELFVAHVVSTKTKARVTTISESDDGAKSPDLRIGGIAYGECKDLRTIANIADATGQYVEGKAAEQLAAGQAVARLPGSVVFVDFPHSELTTFGQGGFWDDVRAGLDRALRKAEVDAVVITLSGQMKTDDSVSYPFGIFCVMNRHRRVSWRVRCLCARLCRNRYRVDRGRFERVCF